MRDIDDVAKMEAWKYAVLHTSFHYKVAKEDEIFWLAQNNRQHKKSDGITMSLTCLQRIFSILNHKQRHEKMHGEISHWPLKLSLSLKGLISLGLHVELVGQASKILQAV